MISRHYIPLKDWAAVRGIRLRHAQDMAKAKRIAHCEMVGRFWLVHKDSPDPRKWVCRSPGQVVAGATGDECNPAPCPTAYEGEGVKDVY